MWKCSGAIEVGIVLKNVIVLKRSEGEVQVEKDSGDTVLWIKKINLSAVIGDGLDCQIAVGWKMDGGDVVFVKKVETRKGGEGIVNVNTSYRGLEDENQEDGEKEE
ncbi:hypothetical protein RYX36_003349 [Vicia faba]